MLHRIRTAENDNPIWPHGDEAPPGTSLPRLADPEPVRLGGTERGAVLPEKIRRYRSAFSRSSDDPPIHVGIVVDSARRAASVGRLIARSDQPGPPVEALDERVFAAIPALARFIR